MIEPTTTERQMIERFLDALRELPDVRAELDPAKPASLAGRRGYDARIEVLVAGKPVTLLIEAKKTVYPRDVRQALWQFRESSHGMPTQREETQSLLIAEAISPGAKEMLRAERVGYYDSGGSLYLPASGAYFYIEKPPPKILTKSVRALFSGRRAQVVHALLVRPLDWFGVKDIAEEAQVSPATASQVLSELDRFDWLVSRGQGPSKERHLREPAALLDAWAKQLASMRPPNLRRYYVPDVKADALVEHVARAFDSHEAGYAISYEAAAQRYAPFLSSVSQVRTLLLLGPSADAAIGEIGARLVTEGANLAVVEAKSWGELLFRERVGAAWLASPVQVYLDLLRGEGRAREMAEHLRKERIGF